MKKRQEAGAEPPLLNLNPKPVAPPVVFKTLQEKVEDGVPGRTRRVQQLAVKEKWNSLAKDRREVLLTSGEGDGADGHEAWMTGRQARRYGVGV